MKNKTLKLAISIAISIIAIALLIISLIIKSAVFRPAPPQKNAITERAIMSDLPLSTSCQGWEYTIKSLEYSDRLPEGITRADCSPDSMESWYQVDETIVNEDGSVNEGYFVVNLDIELEDKEGFFITDDKKMPVNGIKLYAFDDKKSTYIHPYYVSESCYDPVKDADNPRIGYSCVDFSQGMVDLTLSYIVGEEIYSEYEEWNLLLNIIEIDIKSYSEEKAYNKYVEENGYPPFAMFALAERE